MYAGVNVRDGQVRHLRRGPAERMSLALIHGTGWEDINRRGQGRRGPDAAIQRHCAEGYPFPTYLDTTADRRAGPPCMADYFHARAALDEELDRRTGFPPEAKIR